ncbi:MAG: hypothetical protein DWQ02_21855 [Bacteroidetes bacterium]|nr:MAG: hypothetical protein DWQ02_21855 [Bacteroidota bacterium]
MKMSPWRLLAAPFMIAGIFVLYKTFSDPTWSWYLIPCVVMLAVLYVLSPQIDWYWYKRNPPAMPKPLAMFFQKNMRFYQNLSVDQKQKFRDRVSLYMMAADYMPKVFEKVPEDVKAIAAACAVEITLGKETFLFPNYEHIIVYPKAFPSPQYPRNIHPSEIYDHDGVIMFSAEHLVHGFVQPHRYFNVGLYEYARVFVDSYPTEPWPDLDEAIWTPLEQVSGFKKEAIFKYMNIDDISPLAVSIMFFFDFPEKFKETLPDLDALYSGIFNVER